MHTVQAIYSRFLSRRTNRIRGSVCLTLCLLLAACGFHLRGTSPLPFDTLYTNIPQNSEFGARMRRAIIARSDEHTSELQSLMLISSAVFCLKNTKTKHSTQTS